MVDEGGLSSESFGIYCLQIHTHDGCCGTCVIASHNSDHQGKLFSFPRAEEILTSNKALWFSPGGGSVVYATFDDTDVGEISFSEFGGDDSEHDPPPYPKVHTLRYPKAGTDNPRVQLKLMNLKNQNEALVTPPRSMASQDPYVISVRWIDHKDICVVWTNRPQNTSAITLCSPPNYACKEVGEISSEFCVQLN